MSHQFMLAILTYLIATASPGPSNMALMVVAMNQGRRAALLMAVGIIMGSMFWGVMAMLGFAGILHTYAQLLSILKMLGAAYLLWLAFKSWRAAFTTTTFANQSSQQLAPIIHAQRGLHLHLSNPKAIFTWLAIATLAAQDSTSWRDNVTLLGVCVAMGSTVFITYAVVFSSALVRRWYLRWQRGLNLVLTLVFGLAAGKLLCFD